MIATYRQSVYTRGRGPEFIEGACGTYVNRDYRGSRIQVLVCANVQANADKRPTDGENGGRSTDYARLHQII